MRHRSDRNETELLGIHDVTRARKKCRTKFLAKHLDDFALPIAGKAAACTEVADLEVSVVGLVLDPTDFLAQSRHALLLIGFRNGVAKVHLVDDCKNRNLKKNCVQPRSFDHDVNAARHFGTDRNRYVLRLEMKETEKIHKVAFDEAKVAKVIQLVFLHRKRTQMLNFLSNLIRIRTQIHPFGSATEAIFHVGVRELMQHTLHHRELVEVGIEKRLNNHGSLS